jgi:hypothetical protein
MSQSGPPTELTVLDDRYELQEIIGRGGHGVVYRAVDRGSGTDVAIKFLHDSIAVDPQYNIRMLREAQVMAALSGTSAIRVYGLNTTPDGALYLVMELLAGRDFDTYLPSSRTAAGVFRISPLRSCSTPSSTPSSRPRAGYRPSRSQAGKHLRARRGGRALARLRSGQGHGRGPAHQQRHGRRLAELHRARGLERKPACARSPHRHLLARCHRLSRALGFGPLWRQRHPRKARSGNDRRASICTTSGPICRPRSTCGWPRCWPSTPT